MHKFLWALIILIILMFSASLALAGSSAVGVGQAAAHVEAGNGVTANNNQTFEASEIPIPFPNGTGLEFPTVPNFFGPDSPPWNFMPVEMIIQVKRIWTKNEVKEHLSHTDLKVRARYLVNRKARQKLDKPDEILVVLAQPERPIKVLGIFYVSADDADTTSFEVLVKCQLLGMGVKADAIGVLQQGCQKLASMSTKGFMIGNSTATVNPNGDAGTISTGGLGYSKGEAGNIGKPWLQVIAFDYQ